MYGFWLRLFRTTAARSIALATMAALLLFQAPFNYGEAATTAADTPTKALKITIREALQSEYHDRYIELTGVVLRQTGPLSVLIHDGTAAIEISLQPTQIPNGGLKPNTRLRVKGEISRDGQSAHEVEVTELFWTF